MRWRSAWLVTKDVGLTGTGIFVIVAQVFSARPNGLLLGTGLALTVPSTWEHIKALLPSSADGSSSDPSELPGPPPDSSSPSSPPPPSPGSSPSSSRPDFSGD